jgi:hypothetical protein
MRGCTARRDTWHKLDDDERRELRRIVCGCGSVQRAAKVGRIGEITLETLLSGGAVRRDALERARAWVHAQAGEGLRGAARDA